ASAQGGARMAYARAGSTTRAGGVRPAALAMFAPPATSPFVATIRAGLYLSSVGRLADPGLQTAVGAGVFGRRDFGGFGHGATVASGSAAMAALPGRRR